MDDFFIDFKWLDKESGSPVARAAFAEIEIAASGVYATDLLDLTSRTTRNVIRVSAYTLALWFAHNWWRLRWEPERSSISWKMSHSIGAAGEGYLWPSVSFISDGKVIQVQSRATSANSPQPIRFLNSFDNNVSAVAFERAVDIFMEAVIGRLKELSITDEVLSSLWNEVLEERMDADLSLWRRLEAVLGIDPDEAPDAALLPNLVAATKEYGTAAMEELAAESQLSVMEDLAILWNGARRNANTLTIPACDRLSEEVKKELSATLFSWQAAISAARTAREVWSLGKGPLKNIDIADLFQTTDRILKAQDDDSPAPINAGYRLEKADVMSASLNSRFEESRRFALFRLVADHLMAPQSDRLLPAGQKSKTQRQKFQRAFAQELLCPYDDLISDIGSADPTDEEIEEAAHYFMVSPIMIQTILVNRGDVDRGRFF